MKKLEIPISFLLEVSSTTFKRKGLSRIFVFNKKHISLVETIISEINEDEFENYYPEDLVTEYPNSCITNNDLIYNGKFDINIKELINKCYDHDIAIIVKSIRGDL